MMASNKASGGDSAALTGRPVINGILILALIPAMLIIACSLIGGPATRPSGEAEGKLSVKEVSDKVYEDIKASGDFVTHEEVTKIVSNAVTNQMTTYQETNNTPFWQIVLPIALVWFGWGLCKFVKKLIVARIKAGSTWRNFIGL